MNYSQWQAALESHNDGNLTAWQGKPNQVSLSKQTVIASLPSSPDLMERARSYWEASWKIRLSLQVFQVASDLAHGGSPPALLLCLCDSPICVHNRKVAVKVPALNVNILIGESTCSSGTSCGIQEPPARTTFLALCSPLLVLTVTLPASACQLSTFSSSLTSAPCCLAMSTWAAMHLSEARMPPGPRTACAETLFLRALQDYITFGASMEESHFQQSYAPQKS